MGPSSSSSSTGKLPLRSAPLTSPPFDPLPHLKQIFERYTRMTGRPPLLPAWTFGLWLSTSFLTSYSSETVSSFLQGMQQRNCPVRVFHLDCFWMKQYEWLAGYVFLLPILTHHSTRCSFTFDPDNFPDPKKYIEEIKQKYGVKVCLWSVSLSTSPICSDFNPFLPSQPLHFPIVSYLRRRCQGRIFHQEERW
jgi:alpha-glucosidase (family GH31 glycosyl hydrolase)